MPEAMVKSSGIVIPHAPKMRQRALARLVYFTLHAVAVTLRIRQTDRSGFFSARPGPAIYCVWHNRLALSMICYRVYISQHNRSSGLAVMVSASRDGGFLTGLLECFGVRPVRGSTSRRGPQALRELTTWARRGFDLALTPDGPRGPRYVAQPGVIALAQLSGLPIVPVAFNLRWKLSLKSWDQFQIPLPFSRCEMIYANPIRVPREAGESDREKFRLELEQALRGISVD